MSFYNILKEDINKVLKYNILKKKYKKEIYNMFQVSEPPKGKFGDVSTNAAFSLSKFLKIDPKMSIGRPPTKSFRVWNFFIEIL